MKFAFYSDGLEGPKDIHKSLEESDRRGIVHGCCVACVHPRRRANPWGERCPRGSIEPGKIANLVVTDGDLFGEKTKTAARASSMASGIPVHEEAPPG